ncbi:MAG: glycosyltransferase family 2 protein [Deltaproteobacteria bacterium]|nr:glycosyltransferase family 2 protein [Candidatus Tharpella sp.]
MIEKRFPQVELIKLTDNVGFARANNIGLEMVDDCLWVALLNPDAYPAPDWLEKMSRAVALYPEYTFFGSRMLAAGQPEKLDGIGDCYHFLGLPWRLGHGREANGKFLFRREIFSPCAAAALYRREIVLEIGGFDEDFFCFLEDVDLGFRLRLAGYRCCYVPEAVVLHEGSVVTGRQSPFSVYHGHRNLVWAFVKNMPQPAFLLFVGPHLIFNFLVVVWYLIRSQGTTIVRAKYDAIKGLSVMLEKRRQIQARRKASVWSLLKVMSWGWWRKKYCRI